MLGCQCFVSYCKTTSTRKLNNSCVWGTISKKQQLRHCFSSIQSRTLCRILKRCILFIITCPHRHLFYIDWFIKSATTHFKGHTSMANPRVITMQVSCIIAFFGDTNYRNHAKYGTYAYKAPKGLALYLHLRYDLCNTQRDYSSPGAFIIIICGL